MEIIAREAVEHCVNIMWNPSRDGGVAALLSGRLTTELCRVSGIVFRYVTTMSSALQRGDALRKEQPCTQITNSQFVELRPHFLAWRYNFNRHSPRFLSCISTTFDTVLSNKHTVTSFPYHLVRSVTTLSLLFRCVCFERPDASPSRQTVSGGRTPHRHFSIVLGSVFR